MLWIFRLLFRWKGWKFGKDAFPPGHERCVMIAAPHTSNWDTVFMMAAFSIAKVPLRFAIKKEWMIWPFAGLFKAGGAIGIDRSPKEPGQKRKSYVDAMADLFEENDKLVIGISPEGTRKLVDRWKTGFYWIALKAKVPIGMSFLNYETKTCGFHEIFYPTGNFNQDMEHIMQFYRTAKAKFPEKYYAGFVPMPEKEDE